MTALNTLRGDSVGLSKLVQWNHSVVVRGGGRRAKEIGQQKQRVREG